VIAGLVSAVGDDEDHDDRRVQRTVVGILEASTDPRLRRRADEFPAT